MVEDFALDRVQAIADSGVDEDSVAAAHYERACEIEADAVLFVGRMVARPEFPRNHAEHASAIVAPDTIGQKRDRELTHLYFLRRLHQLMSLKAIVQKRVRSRPSRQCRDRTA